MDHHPKEVWSSEPAALGPPELSVMARSMIAARRALRGPLPVEILHDPALDLLLALFVASSEDRRMQASVLIAATTVPPSIGRRWIDVLERHGLVEREGTEVALTEAGVAAVTRTLHAVADSQWHLDEAERP